MRTCRLWQKLFLMRFGLSHAVARTQQWKQSFLVVDRDCTASRSGKHIRYVGRYATLKPSAFFCGIAKTRCCDCDADGCRAKAVANRRTHLTSCWTFARSRAMPSYRLKPRTPINEHYQVVALQQLLTLQDLTQITLMARTDRRWKCRARSHGH